MLIPDPVEENDYVLAPNQSCWITIGQFSLYICHSIGAVDSYLTYEIYDKDCEMDSPLRTDTIPFTND